MKKIKNIIFDLGGVIVNLNANLTIQAFNKLGISDFDKLYTLANQSQLFDRLDRGEISDMNFRNEIRNLTGLNISDEKIDDAWNKMILDAPYSRLSLLEKAKSNYNTFLLSNTNSIHINTFTNYLNSEYNVKSLQHYFSKKTYLSYEIGMRKPEKRIFNHVIEDSNLNPSETLFIDDTIEHIRTASGIGINSYLLEPDKENLEDLFENGILKRRIINQQLA